MRTETRSWHPWIAFGTVALVVFLLVVGAGARHAFAAVCDAPTKTWDGGGGNDLWSTANNWNPNGVPGTSDDVCLSGAGVRITTPTSVRSFEVNSGTLTVESTGGLGLAQPSSIDTGAQLTSIGNVNGNGTSILSNDGTINITGNSLISTKVTNQGEIDSSAPSTAILSAGLTNATSGTVHVLSGILDLRGPTTSNGTMQVDQGATLSHDSGTTEYQAGSITGQGHMSVTGAAVTLDSGVQYGLAAFQVSTGTLTLNDDYTVDSVTMNSGILTGSGNLTIRNALTMAIFSVMNRTGTNTTTIQAGATATLTTGSAGQSVSLGRPLIIDSGATLTVAGDGQLATGGGAGSIANSGTMNVTGNSQVNVPVTNTGALTKSSSGTTSMGGGFTNAGTVDIQSGTLQIGSTTTSSGVIHVASGATLNHASGTTTYTKDASITGAGQMLVGGATVVFQSDGTTKVNYGLDAFRVNSGTLTLNDNNVPYSVDTVIMTGGILNGPGDLTVAQSLTMAKFTTMGGTGTTTVESGAPATLDTGAAGQNVVMGRPLVIDSGATLTVAGDGQLATGSGPGAIANSGTMNVTGNSQVNVPVTNTGALTKSSSGTTSMGGGFTNAGTVDIQSGTLQIGSTTTSSGVIHVASGATLNHASGTTTYTKDASITGAGQMLVGGATVVFQSDGTTKVNYGLDAFRVNSGTLTLNDNNVPFSVDTVIMTGGILNGPGNLTVAQSLTMAKFTTMGGTGTTTVESGAPRHARHRGGRAERR